MEERDSDTKAHKKFYPSASALFMISKTLKTYISHIVSPIPTLIFFIESIYSKKSFLISSKCPTTINQQEEYKSLI